MSIPSSPGRLGVPDDLVPRLAAAGWIAGDEVVPSARPLLAELRRGPEPQAALERLAAILAASSERATAALERADAGDALVRVAGASRELSRTLVSHPGWLLAALDGAEPADPDGIPGLRHRVRRGLLRIAVRDLNGTWAMPQVGEALSDLADDAAARALEEVRLRLADRLPAGVDDLPVAVIAMGKWGARELNYASDIDVLFVHGVPDGCDPAAAAGHARLVASGFIEALSGPSPDGVAFRVDPGLRPEGAAGPLTRSIEAYHAYYERWADTWEFQALLKARPAAGDPGLGEEFMVLIEPFVYPETLPPAAVRAVRAMKERAEDHTRRRGTGANEIKRGVGGIRDVEFAVQLLQMVHGRFDPALRARATLDLLGALADGGYVRAEDAAALMASYPWLRDLEHRLQLYDLRQTHELPADPAGRERLAKAMGYRDDAARSARDAFEADLVRHRASVRTIYERLFYRPLLEAFAASPAGAAEPERAARQLVALGFVDVEGAQRAFADLTAGLSRRSRLMQQLLPLMLDWLSAAPDPDLGLDQLRALVTGSTDNARLIAQLRDNPVAAERLCRLLGTSRLLGRLLDQIPEALAFIGDDELLRAVPDRAATVDEVARAVAVRRGPRAQQAALRLFARRRLLRTAVRDLLGVASSAEVGRELSDVADGVAAAALGIAVAGVEQAVPMAVVAMGKWGGRELNYASDLDVLFVHRVPDGVEAADAAAAGQGIAEGFLAAIGRVTPEGVAFRVDADLRPEGRAGPLARSLEAYRAYYDRWAQTWEFQTLVKARFVAGDAAVAGEFLDLVRERVYRPSFPDAAAREIRTMKARIEQERIPADEDPGFHMKLGHGSLADVEFTTQLLQLTHGGADAGLRATGTREALAALHAAGHLDADEMGRLVEAYDLCSRIRNRLFLQAGRPRDSLPTDPDAATRLAVSLGYEVHPRSELREAYRRVTRRARRVVEGRFYGAGDRPARGREPERG